MKHPDTTQSCPYSPHSGPVGCLPAPNIFPLAKETFAKGKMFGNLANEFAEGKMFWNKAFADIYMWKIHVTREFF